MGKRVRSSLGSFVASDGEAKNEQILVRMGKAFKSRLVATIPNSGDRSDFIRAAIAEKLERDSI